MSEVAARRAPIFGLFFHISTNASGLRGLGIMDSGNFREAYLRAEREKPALGFATGKRPEPTLDEARTELSQAISRVLHNVFQDRYGPLVGAISEPTINEFLKGFEANLARAKGDVTLVAQELLDRVMPPASRRRK
jgi:hypothetical protein